MVLIKLDTAEIRDWQTFHDLFSRQFGFPTYYGRNMNAWIDCMSYLDEPDALMTSVHVKPGEVLLLQLDHMVELRRRFPQAYDAIVECSAFVNYRKVEAGEPPLLALSFRK